MAIPPSIQLTFLLSLLKSSSMINLSVWSAPKYFMKSHSDLNNSLTPAHPELSCPPDCSRLLFWPQLPSRTFFWCSVPQQIQFELTLITHSALSSQTTSYMPTFYVSASKTVTDPCLLFPLSDSETLLEICRLSPLFSQFRQAQQVKLRRCPCFLKKNLHKSMHKFQYVANSFHITHGVNNALINVNKKAFDFEVNLNHISIIFRS